MWRKLKGWCEAHPAGGELLAAPAVLLSLFCVAFRDFLGGDRSVATFPDNTYLILPIFHHISDSFSRGDFPYWMNTVLGGLPLYNSPQFSPTYPLYFFQSGLYASAADALRHVHDVTVLHLLVLYANAYVLLRVLRLAPPAALLGASLLAFSANTFDYSVWVNTTAPYSWFPLVLACAYLVMEERHARVAVPLGGLALGLLALASTSQPLIHMVFVLAVLYAAHAARRLWRGEARALFRTTRNLTVMGLLGVALAAPSALPTLSGTAGMIRFLGDHPPISGFDKIPFPAFLEGQLRPGDLAGVLLPLDVRRVVGNSYIGLSAVLLALFSVFKARSNWVVLPFLFIAAYGLLSATGDHFGVARLNYQLPLINKIREPPRHLFLFVLGTSALAAYGFSHLCEALGRGYGEVFNRKSLPAAAAFAVLCALSLRSDLPYVGAVPRPYLLAACALVVGLLLTLPRAGALGRRAAVSVAVLLVICSTLQYSWYVPKLQDGDYFRAENLTSHKTLEELARLGDARHFRFLFQDDKLKSAFWSMNASYHGLRSFQVYMNPLPKAQFEEVYQRFYLNNYYPLLGAKYYLCNPCDQTLLRDFQYRGELNGYRLHVADRALPRYALFNRVGGSYVGAEDFYNRIHAGYDYTREVYVNDYNLGAVSEWLGAQESPPEYVLKEEHSSLNRLRLSVNTRGRAVLILNEYYNRAWKVRVNGAAVVPFRVNLNQLGVLLDSGGSLVDFAYHPALFVRSLWLQRAAFAGLLLYAAWLAVSAGRALLRGRAGPGGAAPAGR